MSTHIDATRPWRRSGLILGLLLAGLALSGCNKEPFKYVQVKGKVTYDDGSLIQGATGLKIEFIPQDVKAVDEKTHPPHGSGQVNVADGTYSSITSHTDGDGILAGKHKVCIIAIDTNARKMTNVVGEEYTNPATTPLTYDTANADKPPDFTVKKPGKK